jgi:2-keto-4-pentenoate hydratase
VSLDASISAAFDPHEVARRFVNARLNARALPDFPGPLPADLAGGYTCQDRAIALWPDRIAGWKVGRIPDELQQSLGAARVAGPVFSRTLIRARDPEPVPLSVIAGGFAAVEAEYIYRIGRDTPAAKTVWTPEEALAFVDTKLVGVEFAGSPLAAINVLGPRAVASDFGNNAALILGPEIPGWRSRPDGGPPCEVFIDGVSVGTGSPAAIPGGPPASLAFLLGLAAARGYPLKAGEYVTTGAASGIHDIEAGQTARITFGELGEIRCIAVPARPDRSSGGRTKDDDHDVP